MTIKFFIILKKNIFSCIEGHSIDETKLIFYFVWFHFFNGISTFAGYLILVEEEQVILFNHILDYKVVHTFASWC